MAQAFQAPISLQNPSGDNQTAQIGSVAPSPLTVQITGTVNVVYPPTPVVLSWTIRTGDATFVESDARSYTQQVDVQGLFPPLPASTHIAFGSAPGPVQVQVYCGVCQQSGGSPFAYVFSLTSTPANLTILSGDGQTGAIGSQGAAPLVVQFGNPGIPGQTVSWTVLSGQATLSATSSTTDSSGQASISFQFGASPGTVAIQASTVTSSVTFHETAYVPQVAAASGNNQTGIAGSTLQPFVV
jgi:hypothetical protein